MKDTNSNSHFFFSQLYSRCYLNIPLFSRKKREKRIYHKTLCLYPLFQKNIGKMHKSPSVLIAAFTTQKIWVDVTSFYFKLSV